MKLFSLGLVLSACVGASVVNAQHQNVQVQKPPAWVETVTFNETAAPDVGQETGFYCLLIDKQEHVAREESYTHIAYKILTAEGVQAMSDLTFDFDPSYQILKVHSVRIHRGGQVLEKLPPSIQTIQREQSMDRYLYDGSLTAIINLTDVRVGDVIEYAFTKKGYNPVYEGHIGRKIYLTFGFAYDQLFERLIVPSSASLNLEYRNADVKPKVTTSGNEKEYTWSIKRMNAMVPDNNIPAWYDGNHYVMLTDYDSWGQVALWASRHFEVTPGELKDLKQRMSGQFNLDDRRKFTLNAIRFVQDEIRYLGFEGGLNSHKPHSPVKVFDQRFGDCKDKSLLLCAMLTTADIEAHPVLVNTLMLGQVDKESPSIGAFNHCVVQIVLDDQVFYIDPTINNQGGNLQQITFPPYEKGLIVDGETNTLERLFSGGDSEITETQTIAIPNLEGEAYLQVTTVYKGGEADYMRREFLNNSTENIQKNYLAYYGNLYADIETLNPVSHSDNRRENIFTVQENYRIPTFWKPSPGNEDVVMTDIYPLSLQNFFTVPKSSQRTSPYALAYPVSYHHTFNIKVPDEWNVQQDEKYIDNDYYHYEYYVRHAGKDITVETHYRTKQDHVPATAVAQFVSDHEEMYNNLSFQLSFNKNIAGNKRGISWLGIVAALLSLTAGIWLMLRLYYFYDPKPQLTIPGGGQPIGGWLILVGIGLVVSPFRMVFDLFSLSEFYDSKTWANLIALKQYGTFGFVLITHIYNVIFFTFMILVLILFMKRRSSVPKLICVYYGVNAFMTFTDSLVGAALDPVAAGAPGYYQNMFTAIVGAAIWIPYFRMSTRVKETFVTRINDDDDPEYATADATTNQSDLTRV